MRLWSGFIKAAAKAISGDYADGEWHTFWNQGGGLLDPPDPFILFDWVVHRVAMVICGRCTTYPIQLQENSTLSVCMSVCLSVCMSDVRMYVRRRSVYVCKSHLFFWKPYILQLKNFTDILIKFKIFELENKNILLKFYFIAAKI